MPHCLSVSADVLGTGASDGGSDGLLLCEGTDVARCMKDIISGDEGGFVLESSLSDELMSPGSHDFDLSVLPENGVEPTQFTVCEMRQHKIIASEGRNPSDKHMTDN